MSSAALLALAFVCALCGAGWFALAVKQHWQQVRPHVSQAAGAPRRLRSLGVAALSGALALDLVVDPASIAVLVFSMELTAATLAVAMVLAYRPSWLAWLVAFGRPRSTYTHEA